MAKQREHKGARCMADMVRHRSSRYPQCTYDAVFHLEWVANGSGLPNMGTTWTSYACAHHVAQIIRHALAWKDIVSPVKVKGMPDDT